MFAHLSVTPGYPGVSLSVGILTLLPCPPGNVLFILALACRNASPTFRNKSSGTERPNWALLQCDFYQTGCLQQQWDPATHASPQLHPLIKMLKDVLPYKDRDVWCCGTELPVMVMNDTLVLKMALGIVRWRRTGWVSRGSLSCMSCRWFPPLSYFFSQDFMCFDKQM